MDTSYIIWIILFIVLYSMVRKKKFLYRQIIKRKNSKERLQVKELAAKMIGKRCTVFVFDSSVTGIIREVTDDALLLEVKNTTEIINIDFIMRIRELPVKNR